MPEIDPREEQERHAKQVHELETQVKFLEDEIALLRRRLTNSPRQVKILEEKLVESKSELSRALSQNEKLASVLRSERDKIEGLKEEVEKLSLPPASFGVYLGTNDDGTIDVSTGGRKLRVNVAPEIEPDRFHRGVEVILNEALNVVEVLTPDRQGEVVKVKDRLDDDRVMVVGRGDEEMVATIASELRGELIRAGDPLLLDARSGLVLEKLPKEEVEELVLEEIPDITYEDIGGLEGQIEDIRDAVELPFLYAELFAEHQLKPPKGVLLYGPPGCGKTLIAKAVARSLAEQVQERTGLDAHSYFLNIKGPELLNKYVGETERQIRQIFQRAKERSEEGLPVIVFFDEMDSIFRTRGTGISSDVESTIVPQLLSELDGVETLKNVIVIGASNREDLIDPAILRPGRLDVKIKIERPTAQQASDIMSKYLHPSVPIHKEEVERTGVADISEAVSRMIERTIDKMYATSEENRFLEVTYASGDKEILYFKDFNSGAMIENIVRRAKKEAIKRFLSTGEKGIKGDDLLIAIRDEFKENEDLPNTTNPDDWARISGKKGERIVYVRTLLGEGPGGEGRQVERVAAGQYL
jgi:proteasome-associated ATPase